MIVKNVLKNAVNYLGLTHLLNTNVFDGSGSVSDEEMAEINTLINCLNLVVNQVASEYFILKDKVKVNSVNGVIYYSQLSNKVVSDILNVKQLENIVSYVCKADRLETVPGVVEVEFAYQPGQVSSINEIIDFSNYKINERVLAYGVVAEYNFLYANYDDATIWDNRFKNSLSNLIRPRREIKIKQRLWV